MTPFEMRASIKELNLRVVAGLLIDCLEVILFFADEPGDMAADIVAGYAEVVLDKARDLKKLTG